MTLLDLVNIACPVRIVAGSRAPAPIRSLARLMRVAVQTLSITQVKGARGAAHLTDPHVVGPEVCKFVVSSDREWHTRFGLPAAA